MLEIQLVFRRIIEKFSSFNLFNGGILKPDTPIPKGRYNVGYTDVMVGPNEAANIGCFFRLYYPTDLENIFNHSFSWENLIPDYQYIDGCVDSTLKLFSTLKFLPRIPLEFISKILRSLGNFLYTGRLFGPAVFDADLSKSKHGNERFPVVIFSHGGIACRTSYSIICTELASQGFIVSAIEHRDESACATYYLIKDEYGHLNKKWIPFKEGPIEDGDEELRKVQVCLRVDECRRTLDILEKINEGLTINHLILSSLKLGQFKESMDFTNLVIAGHSFGGATTLRTLALDKRFKLGVALDTWMYPLKDETLDFYQGIKQPILFVNMEDYQMSNFQTTGKGKVNLKRLITDITEVDRPIFTLKGANHLHQTDFCLLITRPFLLELGLGVKFNINPSLAMDLNNRLILQFLRKHLGMSINEEDATFLKNYSHLIIEDLIVR